MFFLSDHARFKKPVIVVKMVSAEDLYYRAVITCIQTVNNNNTSSNFQTDHTYILERGGINTKERKQAQKRVQ